MQCIYSCTVFILYLLIKFIYFVAIHAEIIQMYLFSILNVNFIVFIHVFSQIIFTHELI